jgi:hypothetical protein
MSPEESRCFQLLDAHARTKHGCFLAEFFPKGRGDGSYLCCIRPAGPVGKETDLVDRFACKYVTIDSRTVQSFVSNRFLPPELQQLLDEELLYLLGAKS